MPWMKGHTAPSLLSLSGPPIMAVSPSADSATLTPKYSLYSPSFGLIREPCCVHVRPACVNTHAAPIRDGVASSAKPLINAVLPFDDSATADPKSPLPVSSLGVIFLPCCFQVVSVRLKTQAAPRKLLSSSPPISAVLPSEERAVAKPNPESSPASSVPVSF